MRRVLVRKVIGGTSADTCWALSIATPAARLRIRTNARTIRTRNLLNIQTSTPPGQGSNRNLLCVGTFGNAQLPASPYAVRPPYRCTGGVARIFPGEYYPVRRRCSFPASSTAAAVLRAWKRRGCCPVLVHLIHRPGSR